MTILKVLIIFFILKKIIKFIKKKETSFLGPFLVERVIDGDTIEISDEDGYIVAVRLIGIDTPECVSPQEDKNCIQGQLAARYMERILSGKRVMLEYDKDQVDGYGRILAYVYLDGEMINEKLVKDGFALAMPVGENIKYINKFANAESYAKATMKGLWKFDYEGGK